MARIISATPTNSEWRWIMQAVEDDYMSDAFLKDLEDVRPGLLSREAKRKAKVRARVHTLGESTQLFRLCWKTLDDCAVELAYVYKASLVLGVAWSDVENSYYRYRRRLHLAKNCLNRRRSKLLKMKQERRVYRCLFQWKVEVLLWWRRWGTRKELV